MHRDELQELLVAIRKVASNADTISRLAVLEQGLTNYRLVVDLMNGRYSETLSQDAVWHSKGRSYLAGDYKGPEEIGRMREASSPSHFSLQQPPHTSRPLDLAIGERDHVVALRSYKSAVPDDDFSSINGLILHMKDDRIVEVWRFDFDQDGFDKHVENWQTRPEAERKALVEAWERSKTDGSKAESRDVRDSGEAPSEHPVSDYQEVISWSAAAIRADALTLKRTEKDMSRASLSKLSGVSKARIDQLEAGIQPRVRLKTALSLATALDCKVRDIASEASRHREKM